MLQLFGPGVGRLFPSLSERSILVRQPRQKIEYNRWSRLRAATEDFELTSDLAEQDGVDYYAVLGVSPNADHKTIKKAYHKAMRDYHPDISMDEDATEFCIFLNEVYDVLLSFLLLR